MKKLIIAALVLSLAIPAFASSPATPATPATPAVKAEKKAE